MAPVIPRYKRGPVDAQVQTEKFGGLADQASAQGYGQVANAQKGLAAQQGQRARQEVQSFAQRLSQFSSQLDSAMKNDANIKGQKAGVVDVAKRREEVFKLQYKYAGNEKLMQQKIDELETATMEDNFSFYGRAYSNSVDASYANQIELDAANGAAMAMADAKGDPDKFKDAYRGYESQMVKGAPNEIGSIVADKAFQKHGASTYAQMTIAKYAAEQAQEVKNRDNNQKGLLDLIEHASSVGDAIQTKALLGELTGSINAQVRAGTMGKTEGEAKLVEAYTKAQVNSFMISGNDAAQNGRGYDFLDNIQNPSTKIGKDFLALPQEVQDKVLTRMNSAINVYADNTYAREEYDNKKTKVLQEYNYTAYLQEIGATGKKMEPSELHELVGEGTISDAQRKRIVDYQNETTDPETLTKFSDGSILVDLTADQIQTLPGISPKDKQGLLKQRESALKSGLYDWTKSVKGRRALDYLAEDYNMPKDTMAMLMAGMNQEKTPQQQAFEDDRRELIEAIEANYKIADQPEGAMTEYKKIKDRRKETNKEVASEEAETNLSSLVASIEAEAEDSGFMGVNKSTPLDVAKEWSEKVKGKNRLLPAQYDRVKARLEGKTAPAPTKKAIKPSKPPKPVTMYNVPKVDSYEAKQREGEWGFTPAITGKDVDIVRVRTEIKNSAFPVINKYGLTIKDGYRSSPGGGAKRSRHLSGNALDVEGWSKLSIADKQQVIRDFKAAGFNGFGVGATTLHVDKRKGPASWSYIGGTATGGGKMPKWAAEAIGS